MSEQDPHLTEAQKQIQRLEKLRGQKEQESKASVEKAFSPSATRAEESIKKLKSMRENVAKPGKRKRLEGKFKTTKLSLLQTQVLERLKAQDIRLSNAAVTRIALNRLLDIENDFNENDLESRIFEVLRQFHSKS